MPPRVYIGTSIVSYLVARPSRDAAIAADQRRTRTWWARGRIGLELYTSPIVLGEARAGEAAMARARLRRLNWIPVLNPTLESDSLARALVMRGPLPARAYLDAAHIAIAAVSGMDILLTWNCKHIANVRMRPTIERICHAHGFKTPILCTPAQLTGG